jgi:hypothetical protein
MPPPGRPATDRKTDQTRAYADQVEKLQWLYRLTGVSSAEFIGPRIEKDLDEAYEKIRPIVEQLQAAPVGG